MIDGQNRNDFKPDLQAINADKANPLTREELRNRLKHIATLCWGLSIDLRTEFEESEKIRAENEQLRAQVVLLGGRLPKTHGGGRKISPEKLEAMTPEERDKYLKKLMWQRAYATRKAKARAQATYAGQNDNNG